MSQAANLKESTLILQHGLHLFRPSWVDYFVDWVDRLRIRWGIYPLLWVILLGIELLIQWGNGQQANGTIVPFHVFYTLSLPYNMAIIHYLDRAAGRALDSFRPALDLNEADFQELRYRMTTLPQRPTWIVCLLGLSLPVVSILVFTPEFWLGLFDFSKAPISVVFNVGIAFVLWPVSATMLYRTAHQLNLVNRIYTRYARINLFEQRPLYAFSGLTARAAVGTLVISYCWTAFFPESLYLAAVVSISLGASIVALSEFLWPLYGVHQLLLAEKERLLVESNKRMEALTIELHQRIDNGNLAQMDPLNKAMASVELEHAALQRMPTWPWQPETIRGVLAALLFPLVVWLTQWILQRLLGS